MADPHDPPAVVPAQPTGWQPIETAPSDGTEIIVHDEGAVLLAWFNEDDHAWIDSGASAPMLPPPQHWMPLPDPPSLVSPGAEPQQEPK